MSAQPESNDAATGALSERELRILEFERQWWRHGGAKEEAIRRDFGLSSARYYQLLNALIDTPGALRSDPMLVKRLRNARELRVQARASRTFSSPRPGGPQARPRTEESNH